MFHFYFTSIGFLVSVRVYDVNKKKLPPVPAFMASETKNMHSGGEVEEEDRALTLCKAILKRFNPVIVEYTDEELNDVFLDLTTFYKEARTLCLPEESTDAPDWLRIAQKLCQTLATIEGITSHVCANNYSSRVRKPLYNLLTCHLRESIFDNVKRKSIIEDEWLFFDGGTGIYEDVEEVEERLEDSVLRESLRIVLDHLGGGGGGFTSDECIQRLKVNLETKTEVVIRKREIWKWPEVMPMTGDGATLVMISSMSNDCASPMRTLLPRYSDDMSGVD